jgi:hypothetical protein
MNTPAATSEKTSHLLGKLLETGSLFPDAAIDCSGSEKVIANGGI